MIDFLSGVFALYKSSILITNVKTAACAVKQVEINALHRMHRPFITNIQSTRAGRSSVFENRFYHIDRVARNAIYFNLNLILSHYGGKNSVMEWLYRKQTHDPLYIICQILYCLCFWISFEQKTVCRNKKYLLSAILRFRLIKIITETYLSSLTLSRVTLSVRFTLLSINSRPHAELSVSHALGS